MGLGLNGLLSFFSVPPKSHRLTSYKRWPRKGLETPDWEPAAWIPGSQTGWVAHARGHLCVASVGKSVSGSHGHHERGGLGQFTGEASGVGSQQREAPVTYT